MSTPAQTPLGYLVSCPMCGGQLQPHVGPPQNTPWLCLHCRRGWWVSELKTDARQKFRPQVHDFGFDGQVASSVAVEHAAAVERGHSVHPSMANLPGVQEQLRAFRGVA